jgi:hypothetical protein
VVSVFSGPSVFQSFPVQFRSSLGFFPVLRPDFQALMSASAVGSCHMPILRPDFHVDVKTGGALVRLSNSGLQKSQHSTDSSADW